MRAGGAHRCSPRTFSVRTFSLIYPEVSPLATFDTFDARFQRALAANLQIADL